MSKRSQEDLLSDILEASTRILSYTKDFDFKDFQNDTKTQDPVIRNVEIIGEAVKHLAAEFKNAYPDIPWKSIAGMRDKLIHDYFENWGTRNEYMLCVFYSQGREGAAFMMS